MDTTKVLHSPQIQTYGETNYLEKSSFVQNQGIVWSSDSNLWKNQLLKENSKSLSPRTKYQKMLRLWRSLGKWRNALLLSDPQGLFILGYVSSDDYFLHSTEHSAITSFSLGHTTLFQVGLIVQDSFNKFIIASFCLVRVSALSIVCSDWHYYAR